MTDERNVLGEPLEPCGTEPLTGFHRDGSCRSGPEDLGSHTVCAVVTAEFLDQQRRSKEPMAWVNLACQHLPITGTARQKLLEADAVERCQKIGRGLDALLRKEQGS